MTNIGEIERKTQNRVIQLFKETLEYDFLGDWHDREDNANIEEKYLRMYITRQGYNLALINKALFEISRIVGDQTNSLYDKQSFLQPVTIWGTGQRGRGRYFRDCPFDRLGKSRQ